MCQCCLGMGTLNCATLTILFGYPHACCLLHSNFTQTHSCQHFSEARVVVGLATPNLLLFSLGLFFADDRTKTPYSFWQPNWDCSRYS